MMGTKPRATPSAGSGAGRARRRSAISLALDTALAFAVTALLSVAFTGLAVHEWLGLSFGVAVIVHLLLGWQWVAATTRRFFGGHLPLRVRLSYLLNAALFIVMAFMIASGLMISEVALPSLGVHLGGGGFWRALHEGATNAVLVLVGLHIAVSWQWIVGTLRRLFSRSRSKAGATVHDMRTAD